MSEYDIDQMFAEFLSLARGDSYVVELAIDQAIAKSATSKIDPNHVKDIIRSLISAQKAVA
jgi:hypothetical protein